MIAAVSLDVISRWRRQALWALNPNNDATPTMRAVAWRFLLLGPWMFVL